MDDEKLKNKSTDEPKRLGGARPGAGRPKGGMNENTRIRMEAKKEFQRKVSKMASKLFVAQYDLAVGEKYLMVKRTSGEGKNKKTWVEIETNIDTIQKYLEDDVESLNNDENYYYMTTKPANNMALDSLLNRAFGKPDEKLDITSDGENINKLKEITDEELDARIRQYFKNRIV